MAGMPSRTIFLRQPSMRDPHERPFTAVEGSRRVEPPATYHTAVPRLVRVISVPEGTREDLLYPHLPRQLPSPSVQSHRQTPLSGPRIGDEEPVQKPLALRPVPHRREHLPLLLGDDEPLLEGQRAEHPVERQQLPDLELVFRKPPAQLDLFLGQPARPLSGTPLLPRRPRWLPVALAPKFEVRIPHLVLLLFLFEPSLGPVTSPPHAPRARGACSTSRVSARIAPSAVAPRCAGAVVPARG
jgi:hypothetical protein